MGPTGPVGELVAILIITANLKVFVCGKQTYQDMQKKT